jgi:hypothetical protein
VDAAQSVSGATGSNGHVARPIPLEQRGSGGLVATSGCVEALDLAIERADLFLTCRAVYAHTDARGGSYR